MEDNRTDEEKEFDLCVDFQEALKNGDFGRFEELLAMGPSVNFQHPTTKETALHIAARQDSDSAIAALLNHPDIDCLLPDEKGMLAWNHAEFFGISDIFTEKILEKTKEQAEIRGFDLVGEYVKGLRNWYGESWFQHLEAYDDFTPD